MHRRKEFLIGSLIGLCIMLLALLAAVVVPDSRTALAQDSTDPSAGISLGVHRLQQGDDTDLSATLRNLPHDPDDVYGFPAYTHRFDLERKVGEEWNDADNCEVSPVGETKNIHPVYSDWKVISYAGHGLSIPTSCPIGTYRVKFVLWDENSAVLVTDTREFTVLLGPSVTIEMPAGPHYRGSSIDATIKFHELIQGASYTYEAYVMNDNPNYADNCEGTGLARNEIFSLGSVDENPEVRTGTITSSCPKENYYLTVRLFNAENRTKATKSEVFNITTNPAAIPSVSVAMSEDSPVTPGTEFDVIFNFYDLQDDTAIRYLDTLTNTGTNQPVGGMDCGGSLVGWGQDASATVIRNPIVNRVTITSDCPEGSYRLKSAIQDNSGNEIISGSIDFDIGDPDLTPAAPSVLNFTAKQNSYFSQQLPTGSGGDGTLSYGATGLPAGLTFNSSTRTIAGTPSGTGTSTVTYTVTDSDGDSDSVDFTITVAPDLTPTAPSVSSLTATQNAPFSQQLTTGSGGDGTLSYAATPLPAGLSFDDLTRTIAGTPTGNGPTTVRYTVTDSDGDSDYVEFTITVNADLTPSAPSVLNYTVKQNVPFSQQLPAGSGGDGTLSYAATGLPTGLDFISASRTITGTPTAIETANVTYTVTDGDGDSDSASFTITVNADLNPTLGSIAGYTARVGSPFSKVLPAATGGDTPLGYTATNLPAGLSFTEATRTIAGTPTTVEAPTVTYTVRDHDGDEVSQSFTITVEEDLKPTLTTIVGYTARVGSPFSEVLPAATGGDTPLGYTVTNMPTGLSFTESTRTIAGTPTAVESPTVIYTVRDDDGDEASKSFTITVSADLMPILTTITGYTARVGSPFSEVLPAATGGDTPLGYTVTNMPTGLSFTESTRTIAGTPTAVESPTVIYTVRDDDGDEASKSFTITVSADLMPILTTITGYTARVGSPFSEVLPAATGGDTPLGYTVTNMPTGLSFTESTRTIAGTPTAVESPTVIYTVRDDDGDEASKSFTITVSADLMPILTTITGYTARVGSPFSEVLPAATGGDTPLGYTVTNMPTGLSFTESTRTIAGTPTAVESPTVIYTVRDDDGDEASKSFTITVSADLMPILTTITGYTARVGSPFSRVLPAATGGDTPLGYTVSGLPDGLSFTEGTRTIAGTPTTVEAPTVTYTVRDHDGDEVSQSFTITVEEDLKPTLTTIVGYTARVGSPFSEVLPAATGGDTPLGYTVTNMPTGLSFTESTRTIAGTPTAVESPTVIYTVRDDDGDEANQSFTIAVSADLMPTLEAISDSSAKLTKVFTRQLPAGSGGDGDLVHAVTGLPDGLTFVQSSRTITGTPTSAKDFEVTYTATDEDNDEARQTFHIVVYALPSLSEVADIMATKDEVFTLVLTAVSGGKEPFTYTVTGLPTGLSFDKPSLTITGTPTQVQVADVTFAVEDDDGDTASEEFQISVSEGDTEPTFPYTIPDFRLRVDSPFTVLLPGATGGNAPYTYTISGLPETLTFNPDTRWISGTPTASGLHQVTFTATDRDLDPVSQTFELNIAADNKPTEPSVDDLHMKVTRAFNLELPAGANGDPPYVYTVSVLPSGLDFDDQTRFISGTPDTPGMTNVTYTVTDDDGDPISTDFKVTVYPMPSLIDVPDISIMQGDLYTLVLPEVTGGRSPFGYTAGGLPTGLQFIELTRTITGTPTTVETVNVTYEATDEDGDKYSVTFEIDVSQDPMPELDSVSDFNATKGSQFYALLPEASSGNTPLVYSVTGLPAGLQFITETRVITGTPTQMEVATVTYTVTDKDNDQDSVTFKITVNEPDQGVQGGNNQINNNGGGNQGNGNTQNPPALTLSDSTDFSATVGDQFTQQLPAANGGTSPYLYSVTTLPAGLTFDRGTHTISGTPTEAGTTTITYRVTDNNSSQASDDFTITVSPAVLRLSDTTGFTARVGELFTQQLPEATGGTTPYQYSVTTLPAGLTFVQETRTIMGTPTLAETKDVTYTVTDGTSNTASDAFTITVNEAQSGQPGTGDDNTRSQAELTLSDTTGFSATVGELFTQQLPAASAGTPPYAYRATNLPAGLSFVELTRTITGTPTLAETKVVIYTVRDGSFSSASDSFTITVNAAQTGQPGESGNGEGNQQNPLALTLSDTAGFSATVGDLFTQQLPAASGGSSTYAYMVTDLPSGLSFVERTRTITGTPTMAETKVVTYTVADSEFSSASDTFTITVSEGQSGQQGGTGNGGKSGGGGGKSNSGNSGNSGNKQRYIPPAPSPLPSQQRSSSTPIPVAITIPYFLNVRSGPGLDYEVITTVPAGTRASIYGRDPIDDWFQVQIEGIDGMVWIYQELTTVEGSLDGVRFLEQWEIDLIARPGDGPLAITTPDILNVRSGPGLDYDILTTVPKGTQATIIGIGPNSEWYKVNLGVLSEPAWIYAGLTTVTGSLASVKQYTQAEVDGIETGADNPLAITVPTILNVRSGPGTEYEIVTTVAQGTQAEIIGIGPQDEWFLVELDGLDEPAWLYQDLTTVVGSLAGVRRVASWQVGQPSSDTEVERPIAVTYPSLVNVRVGPGESYNVLKAIGQGTRARIMGIGPDENWYLVDIDGLDQLGWIREDLTVLVGSLDNVKRITAEEIAMLPVAIANTALLNVRSGPDTTYGLVSTISEGTWVEVIGVNAQSDWFKVKYDDVGGQGWIYRDLTYLAGPLSGVTQIASAGIPTSTQADSTQPADSTSTPPAASTQQAAVSAISVDLSLPSNGTIDLEVSWTDAGACSELYRIYYRSNADSATYFSLETAVMASTANTKSLSFQTLSDSSLISAWCGSQSTGRQVAEVQIDSNVEGTYSSTPPQPAADAVAAGPVAASRN